jgi:uncharacterized protein (TIGR02421 family)
LSAKSDLKVVPSQPGKGSQWRSYKEKLAGLSDRVVEAQKPIRILDWLKWTPSVLEEYRKSGFKELPNVEFACSDLGYDPEAKKAELKEIEIDIERVLGKEDALGKILSETAGEYRQVVEMLQARGTRGLYEHSRKLYGSASDTFADRSVSVADVAHDLYGILTNMDDTQLGPIPPRDISAAQAVEILSERLASVFGDGRVGVILDDGIAADAAAGSDYVKVRRGATFSMEDIRILEVHEGWAHVGTSLNGQRQPVAKWLAKGPPRTAATQEGLAALLEVLTFASHPSRAHRLNNRVLAIEKAEAGANFQEVFEWYRTEGYAEERCYWDTQRIFRGGLLEGGAPFTKDVVYMKGIVTNYNFLHAAIASSNPEYIRWLFVGKVALEDIPVLAAHAYDGVIRPPYYVPDIFKDLRGLAIWLSISTFWSRLNSRDVLSYNEKVFDH